MVLTIRVTDCNNFTFGKLSTLTDSPGLTGLWSFRLTEDKRGRDGMGAGGQEEGRINNDHVTFHAIWLCPRLDIKTRIAYYTWRRRQIDVTVAMVIDVERDVTKTASALHYALVDVSSSVAGAHGIDDVIAALCRTYSSVSTLGSDATVCKRHRCGERSGTGWDGFDI